MDSLLRKCKVCRNFGITYFVLRIHLLVQQFGDIQALHTACKNRGFIMVSYCDIRAAQNAARALQNKLLRGTKLDIRYSISKENPSQKDTSKGALLVNNLDSSISNQELNRLVKSYGEVKEIRRTMHDNSQIYIEFFDVRAAAAALGGLNGLEVAGKKLQLVPTYPEGTRW
jgi:RNA recognition motif-containing protein